ncbi:MAG: hypothetical protein HC871_14000 [Rhizobiales bacterium]|nr:hypothetical protein [Hyphomicrobiales bacterium]
MRTSRMLSAGLVAAALAAALPVRADDVIEQIDAGRAYYAEGDLARALSEFEFAVNTLRTRISTAFMATLPEAPLLWTADEPTLDNGAALLGTGMMVTRVYEEDKGDGRIIAELLADSPMVQAFSAVFNSPVMIASDPALQRIRLGRTSALLKWDVAGRTGELSVALGGRVLIKLIGQRSTTPPRWWT